MCSLYSVLLVPMCSDSAKVCEKPFKGKEAVQMTNTIVTVTTISTRGHWVSTKVGKTAVSFWPATWNHMLMKRHYKCINLFFFGKLLVPHIKLETYHCIMTLDASCFVKVCVHLFQPIELLEVKIILVWRLHSETG